MFSLTMSSYIANVGSTWGTKIAKHVQMAEYASLNSPMKFKHGAVLVKNGRPIGTGFNTDRAVFRRREITSMHAEIMALKGLSLSNSAGSSLFVVRTSSTGYADSKPCDDCLEILKRFKVKSVYYTTRDGVVKEKVKNMLGYSQPYRPNVSYDRHVLKPKPQ